MAGQLDGKVAVVTGAARGLGRAFALALAAEGAGIIVNDLDPAGASPGPADEVVAAIRAAGGRALAHHADVADYDAVGRMIAAARDQLGGMDILITNAGIEGLGAIDELSPEIFDRMLRVHVYGTFNCVRHAAPVLQAQQSGTIVTIGSAGAFVPMARHTPYAAAKSAIFGMTIMWATELTPHNVNVNCIWPGLTRTGLVSFFAEDFRAAGRMSEADVRAFVDSAQPPENVCPLVVYLCTEAGHIISGQTLSVMGNTIRLVYRPSESEPLLARGADWTLTELEAGLPAFVQQRGQALEPRRFDAAPPT